MLHLLISPLLFCSFEPYNFNSNMHKKFTVLTIVFLSALTLSAQSVKVKKESARIKGETIEGFGIDLEGSFSDVNASFIKYIKALGKVKQNSDYSALTESSLNGKNSDLPILAITKDNAKNAQAWLGVKTNEWPATDLDAVNKQLEKALYDFGVQYYRDKVQTQIDETNRALQAVEKQQQKFTTQNRDLNTNLEDNKREKIQIEKSLEKNKLEYETLLKKIEKNKKDQDSVGLAGEQIKKVIEAQKIKQSKIN